MPPKAYLFVITCKFCKRKYDLADAAHRTRNREVKCPHCKKVIGTVT